MAGVVRNHRNALVGTSDKHRRIETEQQKGEIVEKDIKDIQDQLNHVQSLRGERKTTLEVPETSDPAQVNPEPTAPPTAQVQQPGSPPAYVPQPPPAPQPPPSQQAAPVYPQQPYPQYPQQPYPHPQQGYPPHGYAPPGYYPPPPQGYYPQAPQMPSAPQVAPPPPGASIYQQFQQQASSVGVGSFDFVDAQKKSINFGVIGVGQGGSRIAESFFQLGYPTCVVNTASHDLQNINIPEDQKLLLKIGAGGAGKDLQEGFEAASDYAEDILDLMKNTFPRNLDHILVCCGGGGGSGSGGLPKVIDMARIMGVPVGVVFTLPKDSEGSKVKENACNRLRLLDKKLETGEIAPLILIDNNKIHEMYTGVSLAKFWRLANAQVTGLFHLFNVLSAQNSAYTSLDPADYKTIINSKGCLIYGSTVIEDSSRKTSVAKALRENIAKGLLAEGFDLSLSNIAGIIVTGSPQLMEELPQENVDAAIECLERLVGGGTLHSGVYNENVDKLTVYTIIGGLTLPDDRVNRLLKDN